MGGTELHMNIWVTVERLKKIAFIIKGAHLKEWALSLSKTLISVITMIMVVKPLIRIF